VCSVVHGELTHHRGDSSLDNPTERSPYCGLLSRVSSNSCRFVAVDPASQAGSPDRRGRQDRGRIVLRSEVIGMEWINPDAWLHLDVMNEDGARFANGAT
jgi:hypothetical protein